MNANETWTIGDVVQKIRTEQGISMQDLSRGICSVATLSRIEADERDMDMMMAETIFGRLGYSPDKFEIYTGPEELERYNLRERMQKEKEDGKVLLLDEDVRRYYERYGKKLSALEKQFLKGMEGFLAWKRGELQEAARMTEEAAKITILLEEGEWVKDAVLSAGEMNLLSMLADIYKEEGEKLNSFRLTYQMFRYLDGSERRKKQMADLYVRIAGKLVPMYLEYGETGRAYEVCRKNLELLRETKKLQGLLQMMEWKGRCEERMEQAGRKEQGVSRGSYVRAYYLYLTMGNQEDAERIREELEAKGQWESMQ